MSKYLFFPIFHVADSIWRIVWKQKCIGFMKPKCGSVKPPFFATQRAKKIESWSELKTFNTQINNRESSVSCDNFCLLWCVLLHQYPQNTQLKSQIHSVNIKCTIFIFATKHRQFPHNEWAKSVLFMCTI